MFDKKLETDLLIQNYWIKILICFRNETETLYMFWCNTRMLLFQCTCYNQKELRNKFK
uniref:Uncharacterized protein n=2 Tax=Timema TaxID=61471 RepID=A0A7R9B6W6_TIMSH|nr:unnamed protein product [Timema shepardi]CAD7578156.1 unnamed protein product [Timema californicum]